MDKNEIPKIVYICRDATGMLRAFEHLNECPVYYSDEKGVLVGEYILERVGTLKKEIKYTNSMEY